MMEFINFILHFNEYIPMIMEQIGWMIYILLFLIIFCETGLVVTPFLPGDSIIFACGALVALSGMSLVLLLILFITAAILGDAVNYLIGKKLGHRLLLRDHKFIKRSHVKKAEDFYQKYGGKAILLSRFVPIVRTFAPFVAGIGKMSYRKFAVYNVIGGGCWVVLFLCLGLFFGNLTLVQEHFSLIVIAIVLISLVPVVVEVVRARYPKNALHKEERQ